MSDKEKLMDRLTRPGITVDPTAARFMGAEVKIQDISDKLLHLILNGPTINSINKDTLRHMVRQLYDELSQYENGNLNTHSWIPVTERLPEKDVRVLVWVGENSCNFPVIDTDRIHCGRWVRWDERITHWMPLPEPPKGE